MDYVDEYADYLDGIDRERPPDPIEGQAVDALRGTLVSYW